MQEVLRGYKDIFSESEKLSKEINLEEEFKVFREGSAVYHFLGGNNAPHLRMPDAEAMQKGRAIDYYLFNRFVSQGKSQLGYLTHKPVDAVESRHLMMVTLLFSTTGLQHKHIVEIGGGFGNWARLATGIVDFDKWTIIDLPFVIELQKWFLKEELEEKDFNKVEFVSTDDYPDWKKDFNGADTVIGAHSLNEFSLEDFQEYFDSVVSKCENFFYASPVNGPSEELVNKKAEIIDTIFKSQKSLLS